MIQATDRNYDWFKSIYRNNLTKLTAHRVANKNKNAKWGEGIVAGAKLKETIQATDIPPPVFGGEVTDVEESEFSVDINLLSVFDKAFWFERN